MNKQEIRKIVKEISEFGEMNDLQIDQYVDMITPRIPEKALNDIVGMVKKSDCPTCKGTSTVVTDKSDFDMCPSCNSTDIKVIEEVKKLATYIHHVIYEADDNEIIENLVFQAILAKLKSMPKVGEGKEFKPSIMGIQRRFNVDCHEAMEIIRWYEEMRAKELKEQGWVKLEDVKKLIVRVHKSSLSVQKKLEIKESFEYNKGYSNACFHLLREVKDD